MLIKYPALSQMLVAENVLLFSKRVFHEVLQL